MRQSAVRTGELSSADSIVTDACDLCGCSGFRHRPQVSAAACRRRTSMIADGQFAHRASAIPLISPAHRDLLIDLEGRVGEDRTL